MGNALTLAGAVVTLSNDQSTQFVLGNRTDRATAALPATTTAAIFTIAGGNILVTQLVGEVTTAIQNQACNLNVQANPTATGSSVDMCAATNVQADVLGTLLGLTGTAGDDLLEGLAIPGMSIPWIVQAGTIDLVTSATNTGSVAWSLFWIPLEAGVTVTAN